MKKYIVSLGFMVMGLLAHSLFPAGLTVPQNLVITTLAQSYYDNAITFTFIHGSDNKIIGKARLRTLEKGRVYLDLLFIEPEYRSKEYGQRLFKLVCIYVKQHGGHILTWQACPFTAPDQLKALPRLVKFYQSLGGQVIRYYDTSADMRLILKKDILLEPVGF